jgi:hypothetical protein
MEKFEVRLTKNQMVAIKNLEACRDKSQCGYSNEYLHITGDRIETANYSSMSICNIQLYYFDGMEYLPLPDGYYEIITPVATNKIVVFAKLDDCEVGNLLRKYNLVDHLPNKEKTLEVVIDKDILLDKIKNAGNQLVFSFYGELDGIEICSQLKDGEDKIRIFNVIMPMKVKKLDKIIWDPRKGKNG